MCDCGNKTIVASDSLTQGTTKSCGCLHLERSQFGPKNKTWKGCGDIPRHYWTATIDNAKRRFIEFNITIEYASEIFIKQDKKCAMTGLPLIFKKSQDINRTASLDRIDSSKGYVEGNVQWVHKDINIMKSVFKQDYFIEICSLVYKNRIKND